MKIKRKEIIERLEAELFSSHQAAANAYAAGYNDGIQEALFLLEAKITSVQFRSEPEVDPEDGTDEEFAWLSKLVSSLLDGLPSSPSGDYCDTDPLLGEFTD